VTLGRILITGGCGFVGRHFAEALVAGGHDVVLVDPLTPGSGAVHPSEWEGAQAVAARKLTWLEQDCRAYFPTVRAQDFDAIFHLAAIVGGRLSIERAALAVAQDLAIDAAMFEWAATTGARHVVYFSSSAAYPIKLQTRDCHRPLVESDIGFNVAIGVPDLSYGWSKLTGEFLGKLAAERYGISVASYRPFSGYGDDQDLNYPFPSIVNRVLGHRPGEPFVIWGSGDQERDFIHIDDCVRFVLSSYESIEDGSALNLSTGRGTSFRQLADVVAAIAEIDLGQVTTDPSKPEGVFSRVGNTDLQLKLRLSPAVSLMSGVESALAHRRAKGVVR
jgi:UDP-glucose 4-epimerase